MTTTALRVPRGLGLARRRYAVLGAAVTSGSIGLAGAGPADVTPCTGCAKARAEVSANLNEAGFFLQAAELLTEDGNEAAAALATAEVDHFLGLVEDAVAGSCPAC